MAAFPITIDDHLTAFTPSTLKPANRQTSSSGKTLSFPKGTIKKKGFLFTLSWLTQAEYETLDDFFEDNQGVSFTIDFSCTGDTTTYNVVFAQDQIDPIHNRTFPGSYDVQLAVKEA